MQQDRFVKCDHCTENLAGICGHCGGDHHGHLCPTLRGVQPFTTEELNEVLERLSVTYGVPSETEAPNSREIIALLVRDYRSIEAALMGDVSRQGYSLSDGELTATLGILQILYGTEVKE